ncbi:hypothetical protein RQP46_007890 [Phenoliferia psychrophenolica]
MHFIHAHPPAPASSDVPRNKANSDAKAYYPLTSPAAGTALPDPDKKELTPMLYTPITIGMMTFKNRVFVAPYVTISG